MVAVAIKPNPPSKHLIQLDFVCHVCQIDGSFPGQVCSEEKCQKYRNISMVLPSSCLHGEGQSSGHPDCLSIGLVYRVGNVNLTRVP